MKSVISKHKNIFIGIGVAVFLMCCGMFLFFKTKETNTVSLKETTLSTTQLETLSTMDSTTTIQSDSTMQSETTNQITKIETKDTSQKVMPERKNNKEAGQTTKRKETIKSDEKSQSAKKSTEPKKSTDQSAHNDSQTIRTLYIKENTMKSDKPDSYFIERRAKDKTGRRVPVFKTSKEAFLWGENHAINDTWYGLTGWEVRSVTNEYGVTLCYFAYMY